MENVIWVFGQDSGLFAACLGVAVFTISFLDCCIECLNYCVLYQYEGLGYALEL